MATAASNTSPVEGHQRDARADVEIDLDSARHDRIGLEVEDALDKGSDWSRVPLRRPLTSEVEQVLDDPSGAFGLLDEELLVVLQVVRQSPIAPDQLAVGDHRSERVVHLVGNAGGELSDDLRFLRLDLLLPEAVAVGGLGLWLIHGRYPTVRVWTFDRPRRPTLSWPLTEEERLLRDTARDFAEKEVAPGAAARDEEERFDREIFRRMGALGFTGAPFPEEAGGAGFTYLGWTLVMEELGAADMATAVTLSVHILSQYPILTWGTEEQRARWLPAMLAGDALGAFALTEPHAGSDASEIRTRAERVGPASAPTGYRLSGTKIWISNAPEADRYLVFATVDPEAGPKGITAFLVEKGTPGFRFGAHEKKMGIRSCPAAELVFDGSVVAAENRLGAEGDGYRIALSALAEGRISIAAACVGLARSALEQAAAYLQQRRAFGGPLSEQQGLRFMLAEMARDVAAARALTQVAAAAKDRGEPIGELSSLAKWTASDAAMRVATDAVQLFGGSGYSRETGIERLMRDAKGAQIYEGTNQIHRLIVADELLKRTPAS